MNQKNDREDQLYPKPKKQNEPISNYKKYLVIFVIGLLIGSTVNLIYRNQIIIDLNPDVDTMTIVNDDHDQLIQLVNDIESQYSDGQENQIEYLTVYDSNEIDIIIDANITGKVVDITGTFTSCSFNNTYFENFPYLSELSYYVFWEDLDQDKLEEENTIFELTQEFIILYTISENQRIERLYDIESGVLLSYYHFKPQRFCGSNTFEVKIQ